MPRPSMGRSARTVAVTVKISQDEQQALRLAYGSPAKGLRHLLDQNMIAPARPTPGRKSGRCRIHRNWGEPTEVIDRGSRTISKICQDCGYVAVTVKPA